ncbi:MAG: aminoacyl-tRNA hydrolase [Gammaproteobacteria bacterium]
MIVGLGNPGAQYEQTRHNAGFWFVDELARRASVTLRHEAKFHGHAAKATIEGCNVWLLRPDTFMNLSGRAVQAMASFYKIPVEHILVVHDEIDLPPGTVRLKRGGGHGGNNGLRDIIQKMGKDFARLRVGVGRPAHSSQVVDYVLHRASVDDQIEIDRAMDDAHRVMQLLLNDGLEKATHRLHSRRDEPSVAKKPRKPKQDKKTEAVKTPSADAGDAAPRNDEIKNDQPKNDKEEPATLRNQLADWFKRKD